MSSRCRKPRLTIAVLAVLWIGLGRVSAQSSTDQASSRLQPTWKTNGLAVRRFQIEGIGSRNNPLRTRISPAFGGEELFVRFRLRYDSASIDDTQSGNGEFFVLWLDAAEGHDASGHSAHIPNVGIHVDEKGANRFMVRYSTSSQRFASPIQGDQDQLVVARLWKSIPGVDQPFDKLDLWIDPNADQEFKPHASTSSGRSVNQVSWIGFSTGVKTELGDKIEVWDIATATTWHSILELPEPIGEEASSRNKNQPKTVSFKKHVHAILAQHCFECHAGADAVEGIRLDALDEVLNQTSPRDAEGSRLIELVTKGEMPPGEESLSKEQVKTLAAWIDEGMDWDESVLPTPIQETDHWAFQEIRRWKIPVVRRAQWVRTPVDAFIAAKHEAWGLEPNPPADSETLNRRLSLDLLGLPPASSDSAEPRSVDELLADPAYGQRWARYWLDVARWAESNGHQHNRPRPHAWRYRDWVIDAFNRDMPYDQFVRMQIAGDAIDAEDADHLVATGFLAAARYSGNELDKEIQRNDILVDVTNTTASALLGLTMECAQCHTHKFDPISIRDYYRFQAFFADAQPENVVLNPLDQETEARIDRRWDLFDQVHARMVYVKRKQGQQGPIYITPRTVINSGMNPTEKREFSELEAQIASLPQTWGYVSFSQQKRFAPNDIRWPLPRRSSSHSRTSILVRGDVQAKGPDVTPAWPAVFGSGSTHGQSTSDKRRTRSDLADWLVDPSNPLTARVWVNRIWQWHFGRGLVETSSDFGTQGTAPSHPKLLDYLAYELIDSGWSTHHIHRLIVNSSTYRQSNRFSQQRAAIDPENRMWWRWDPRRLDAEVIRDSMLVVSDQLDRTAGGRSTSVGSRRRSIYLQQERERFPHQQLLFDGAAGNVSCSLRRVSTSPLQSLWLLNSEFVQTAARKYADRVDSVDEAFELAIGRKPSNRERDQLKALHDQYGMTSVCLALFNSNEFVYLP